MGQVRVSKRSETASCERRAGPGVRGELTLDAEATVGSSKARPRGMHTLNPCPL